MPNLGLAEFIVFVGLLLILPFWMIFKKAGFSKWLSLTMIVPVLGIIALFYLAFAEWPIQKELKRLHSGN